MVYERVQCPTLDCPQSQQILPPGQCCQVCKGRTSNVKPLKKNMRNKNWGCMSGQSSLFPFLDWSRSPLTFSLVAETGEVTEETSRGRGPCSLKPICHHHAHCVDIEPDGPDHVCVCKTGYDGNGTHCTGNCHRSPCLKVSSRNWLQLAPFRVNRDPFRSIAVYKMYFLFLDRDECVLELVGGRYGHRCQDNTVCVNTPGSHRCDCLPGFTRVNTVICEGKCVTSSPSCQTKLNVNLS